MGGELVVGLVELDHVVRHPHEAVVNQVDGAVRCSCQSRATDLAAVFVRGSIHKAQEELLNVNNLSLEREFAISSTHIASRVESLKNSRALGKRLHGLEVEVVWVDVVLMGPLSEVHVGLYE